LHQLLSFFTEFFIAIQLHLQAKKEAELRELAMKARLERGGGLASRIDGGEGVRRVLHWAGAEQNRCL
jgi:hypothetical protein